jgi:predicted PurR-regulated permease PerM
VAAYLLIDVQRVMGFFRSLAPPARRADFDELVAEIDRGLSGVIRGQLLICVVNGLLTTAGLVLFHVKYAVLLGLLAAALSFIPVFGSIVSSVPIVAVALASGVDGVSLSTGLAVLLWIIGIHFLEANLFNPKIIGDAAKIHPVVVVFALLVGEESGGLAGALIAVPTASIVQALFVWSRRRAVGTAP